MVKFSELEKKDYLEDADYVPIIDSSEGDVAHQNKAVLFSRIKAFLMRDVNAAEEKRVEAENQRVENENERLENEKHREDTELGYIAQAKKWTTYSTDTDEYGSDTNNAHYWADRSRAYTDNGTDENSEPGPKNNAKYWNDEAHNWTDNGAEGGTMYGPENNAKYWAQVSQSFAGMNLPTFHIDPDTMELVSSTKPANMVFSLNTDMELSAEVAV